MGLWKALQGAICKSFRMPVDPVKRAKPWLAADPVVTARLLCEHMYLDASGRARRRAIGSAINGLNTATSIDPELFSSLDEFTARVERMIDMTKSGPRATGVEEILIPGEAELRERDRNIKEGVPVRPVTHRSLLKYAEAAKLEARLVIVR